MDIVELLASLDTLIAIIVLLWRIMRQDALVTALLLHILADDDVTGEQFAAKILADLSTPRREGNPDAPFPATENPRNFTEKTE